MRDAHQLALTAVCSAALVAVSSTASAQTWAPAWSPPPSAAPGSGQAPIAPSPSRTAGPGLRLEDSDIALRGVFSVAFPPSDTLDGALVSRGYSSSEATLGIDLALTLRAVGWLFVGGRIGSHWRTLAPVSGDTARDLVRASGIDLLAVTELRIPLGGFELAPDVAAGIAYAEVVQGEGSVTRAAPRFSLGVSMSMWLSEPLRVVGRLGWDLYTVHNVNRFDHDIGLGGTRFDVGLEWRLP
jgi:hypothetical protein